MLDQLKILLNGDSRTRCPPFTHIWWICSYYICKVSYSSIAIQKVFIEYETHLMHTMRAFKNLCNFNGNTVVRFFFIIWPQYVSKSHYTISIITKYDKYFSNDRYTNNKTTNVCNLYRCNFHLKMYNFSIRTF